MRTICVATLTALVLGVAMTPAWANGSPTILTTAPSAIAVSETVRGATPTRVLFVSDDTLFSVPSGGGGATKIMDVGGVLDTYLEQVLFTSGSKTYVKNGAGAPVEVDHAARWLSGRGWLDIYDNGGGDVLRLNRTDGPSEQLVGAGTTSSVVAADHDLVVIGGGFHPNAQLVDFTQLYHPVITALNTTGMSNQYTCPSSLGAGTSTVVGCVADDGSEVVRLYGDTSKAPQIISTTDATDVAVTSPATYWIDSARLRSAVPSSAVVSTTPKATPTALASAGSAVYYSQDGAVGRAGIKRLDATTVHESAARGLFPGAVAVGPGRAAWSDDSRASGAVWSKPTGAQASLVGTNGIGAGPAVGDEGATPIGQPETLVSGDRTAFERFAGVVAGVRTYAITVTDGEESVKVGTTDAPATLSGPRVLFRRSSDRHWILADTATGSRNDLTTTLNVATDGFDTPALSGDYVAFFKSDGSVWRVPVGSTKAKKIIPAVSGTFTFGTIVTDGSWVAATRYRYDANVTFHHDTAIRNARTLGSVAISPLTVVSASVGGMVVESSDTSWAFRPWAKTKTTALPASTQVPTVYANTVGYVAATHSPRIATFTGAVANRPRALHDVIAAAKVKRGKSWTLDLPVTASLTACTVTIRSGNKTVKTLTCNTTASKQGEVRAVWKTGSAAADTYRWTVNAHNESGTLLHSDESTGATTGSVTLTK